MFNLYIYIKRLKTFVLKHCHFHIKAAFIARLNGKNRKQHDKAKNRVNCNKLGEKWVYESGFFFCLIHFASPA